MGIKTLGVGLKEEKWGNGYKSKSGHKQEKKTLREPRDWCQVDSWIEGRAALVLEAKFMHKGLLWDGHLIRE